MVRAATTADWTAPAGDLAEVADRAADRSGAERGGPSSTSATVRRPGSSGRTPAGSETMEIVDELVTPGCPQCAVKHLSAALAYLLAPPLTDDLVCSNAGVCLARARINLAEVAVGYRSHLWYAVGLLVHCEEFLAGTGLDPSPEAERCRRMRLAARDARLTVESCGSLSEAYTRLLDAPVTAFEMATAHYSEAFRELPVMYGWPEADGPGGFCFGADPMKLVALIEKIKDEYFSVAPDFPSPAAGGEDSNINNDSRRKEQGRNE